MKLQISNSKNTLKSTLYDNVLGQPLPAYNASFTYKATSQYSGLLSNPELYAGRTYYVKVIFRTRGDGSPTQNDCSTVAFSCSLDDSQSRTYSHTSNEAYNEIGKMVSWTYSFTVDSDIQPTSTSLLFGSIIDDQTTDLYYYKYWDSEGNTYNEGGIYIPLLEVEDKVNNQRYFMPLVQDNQIPDSFTKIMKMNKYYPLPSSINFFEGNNYKLSGAETMAPGSFSTEPGKMYQWQSDNYYDLTLYAKDNYVASEISCRYNYYETIIYPGGFKAEALRTPTIKYDNSADSRLYIFKNGTLINNDNFNLNTGDTFNISVKPYDVIAIKHTYNGDGAVVTRTSASGYPSTFEGLIRSGNTFNGYLKVSGDSTYAVSGFGQGRANNSTIQFTITKRT